MEAIGSKIGPQGAAEERPLTAARSRLTEIEARLTAMHGFLCEISDHLGGAGPRSAQGIGAKDAASRGVVNDIHDNLDAVEGILYNMAPEVDRISYLLRGAENEQTFGGNAATSQLRGM